MLRYIALILALACAAPAAAQTVPATGQHYFIGTTEELFKIRAAIISQFSDAAIANGHSGFPESDYSAPFEQGTQMQPGPMLRSGALDCMESWYRGPDTSWWAGSAMYLDKTVNVDVDPSEAVTWEAVYVPPASALVTDEDLPQVCKDLLIDQFCGPRDEWWAQVLCPYYAYCCEA